MRDEVRLGFKITRQTIRDKILIPRYYNPETAYRLDQLKPTRNLVSLGGLIRDGHLSVSAGHEVGKMAYGTGTIPFVRTSDISSWEIKTDPKQGVSQEIYQKYSARQDIRVGDILLVRDGTYLIGQSCMVTEQDLPCLIQSHILKFRVHKQSPIDRHLLFASLNAPISKQQIRDRQFTADIIDTIGNRYTDVLLPIPRKQSDLRKISDEVGQIIGKRAGWKKMICKLPLVAQGIIQSMDDETPTGAMRFKRIGPNTGFKISSKEIRNRILIPKYYDPEIGKKLRAIAKTHTLVTLEELVATGVVKWHTGIEVGKMAYGTGKIPFIRTSDISNWELKGDPKQRVSQEIYEDNRQDVKPNDILLVRDGTYLVGTSCMITEDDIEMLYCGGLYNFRVTKPDEVDPYLLLVLLNAPIVKRQIHSKRFTRDIIDTVGKRIFEVKIPVPKSEELRIMIASYARNIVKSRVDLRNRAWAVAREVEGLIRGNQTGGEK